MSSASGSNWRGQSARAGRIRRTDAYRAARSDLRTVGDHLKLFADTPLLFEPGARHHYGNKGYVVLGAVIEVVTGRSYYDHMRCSVFEPVGMVDTDFPELDLPLPNCAVGYTDENWHRPIDGRRRSNHFIYGIKGSPSEHSYSSVHDLFRFFEALRQGRLLDHEHVLALAPQCGTERPEVSYGYGFHIIDDGVHRPVIGHGGRAMGGDAFGGGTEHKMEGSRPLARGRPPAEKGGCLGDRPDRRRGRLFAV